MVYPGARWSPTNYSTVLFTFCNEYSKMRNVGPEMLGEKKLPRETEKVTLISQLKCLTNIIKKTVQKH